MMANNDKRKEGTKSEKRGCDMTIGRGKEVETEMI